MICVTIPARIVLLRQRLGLSQRAFGERIGRTAAYVNRIENGKTVVTPAVIQSISTIFGVDDMWLKTGAGLLVVESVGDRFRQARKARDYTQEELAAELRVSRNSVGMIERGTFRPGDEIIDNLCDKLWIDKNWLLTGVGSMERTELTPFYELLKRDPAVREHIRSFIDHLDHLDRTRRVAEDAAEENMTEEQAERWVTAYVVNDVQQAQLFCSHYNIAYREEDGKVLVKAARDVDQERAHELNSRLRKISLTQLCDHEFIWRDEEGNTVVTYSPYDVEEVRQAWIEKAENNFYGFGAITFVVRC